MKLRFLRTQISDASEVLHLKLWDGTAFDYSLNGNDGTLSGTDISYAYPGVLFNGSDDKITLAADPTIDINGKTALTILAWINPASDGENDFGRIVDKENGTGNGYQFFVDGEVSGLVRLRASLEFDITAMDVRSARVIPINVWSHVVFTYNEDGDKKGKLYFNGALQSLGTDVAGANTITDDSANDLIIGNRSDGTRTFDGKIDNVRILSTAYSAAKMRDSYNQTRWRYGI